MSQASELIFGLERDRFSQATFDLETEKVFSRFWICAGRVEAFDHLGSNSFRRIQIGNYDLILSRDANGQFNCFHNVCRHRGTRLTDQDCGELTNGCIRCPYHAWTYNLQGELVGAPNMAELDGFDRSDFSLKEVKCVNWDGFLMIHLHPSEADFGKDFAPIVQRVAPWDIATLKLLKTIRYEVNANWKIVFQNYSECYHCPTVHPNLNRLTPYRGASNDLLEGPILGGPMGLADGFETVSTDGKKVGDCLPGLSEDQKRAVFYYTLFPSMFVSTHPDYVMVHQLDRVSCSQTNVACYFLADGDVNESDINRAADQWDEVNRQDWEVCELTQKGIESPAYEPGPYSNLEPMLIAFDRFYRSVMDV